MRVRNKGALPKPRGHGDSRARLRCDRRTASKPHPSAVSSTGRRRRGVTPRHYARFLCMRPKTLLYLQNTLLQWSGRTVKVHFVAPLNRRRVAPATAARSLIQRVKCCLSVLWHDSCFIGCGETVCRAHPCPASGVVSRICRDRSGRVEHSEALVDTRQGGWSWSSLPSANSPHERSVAYYSDAARRSRFRHLLSASRCPM